MSQSQFWNFYYFINTHMRESYKPIKITITELDGLFPTYEFVYTQKNICTYTLNNCKPGIAFDIQISFLINKFLRLKAGLTIAMFSG